MDRRDSISECRGRAESQGAYRSADEAPGCTGRAGETILVRLAGITGQAQPSIENKGVVVFCGDHGVTAEGVSAYPVEVTGLMMQNFSWGKAAVHVWARRFGARVIVVDVGSRLEGVPDGVIERKVRRGTVNMTQGPAMSQEEALKSIHIGLETAEGLKKEGMQLVATGEMGIGTPLLPLRWPAF